jgi:hypothetical protein
MAKAAKRPAISEWGTPDPCDEAAYPKAATTTPRQWSWEFLRRREDYRSAWRRDVLPFVNDLTGELTDNDYAATRDREMQKGRDFHWTPPIERMRENFHVRGGGLNPMADPRDKHVPTFETQVVTQIDIQANPGLPHEVLIRFDLRFPLEHQWRLAHRVLLAKQKDRPLIARPQVGKFPLYLRMLDFQERRAPNKEIGKYLFPHASGSKLHYLVRDNDQAAREWQNHYLQIAWLHS